MERKIEGLKIRREELEQEGWCYMNENYLDCMVFEKRNDVVLRRILWNPKSQIIEVQYSFEPT